MATVASLADRIGESKLTDLVVEACRWTPRVRCVHFRPARTTDRWVTPGQGDVKGFPDLIIVGPGGVLWRELKSEHGRLSVEQKQWFGTLAAADQNYSVWRPGDWLERTIQAEIAALARPTDG